MPFGYDPNIITNIIKPGLHPAAEGLSGAVSNLATIIIGPPMHMGFPIYLNKDIVNVLPGATMTPNMPKDILRYALNHWLHTNGQVGVPFDGATFIYFDTTSEQGKPGVGIQDQKAELRRWTENDSDPWSGGFPPANPTSPPQGWGHLRADREIETKLGYGGPWSGYPPGCEPEAGVDPDCVEVFSATWDNILIKYGMYLSVSFYDPEMGGMPPEVEGQTADQLLEQIKEGLKVMLEKNKWIMPHYHRGYIDYNGNGFTTETIVASEFKWITEPPFSFDVLLPSDHHSHYIKASGDIAQVVAYANNQTTHIHGGKWGIDVGANPIPSVTTIRKIEKVLFLESLLLQFNNKQIREFLEKDESLKETSGASKTDVMRWGYWMLIEDGFWPGEVQNWEYYLKMWKEEQNRNVHEYLKNFSNIIKAPFGSLLSKHFDDYAFKLDLPKDKEFGTRKFHYNYTIPKYEEALSKLDNKMHGIIPSLSLDAQQIENASRFYQGSPYHNLLTLDGTIPHFGQQAVAGQAAVGNYHHDWSKAIKSNALPSNENIIKAFSPIFLSNKFLQAYHTTGGQFLFPWIVDFGLNLLPVDSSNPTEINKLSALFNHAPSKASWPPYGGTSFAMDVQVCESLQQWLMKYFTEEPSPVKNWADINLPGFMPPQVIPIDKNVIGGYTTDGSFSRSTMDFYVRRGDKPEITEEEIVGRDFTKLIQHPEKIVTPWVDFSKPESALPFDMWVTQAEPGSATGTKEWTSELWVKIAMGKIKDYIGTISSTGPTRCLHDIINAEGKAFAHAEALFYGIEKNIVKEDSSLEMVQKFYMAAPFEFNPYKGIISNNNFMKFIDSQLKFNETYQYNVYAYVMVIGNEYRYVDIASEPLNFQDGIEIDTPPPPWSNESPGGKVMNSVRIDQESWPGPDSGLPPWAPNTPNHPNNPIAKIKALNEPKVLVLKIPYTKFAPIYTSDFPPVKPDVEIIPYKNINNKLLFWLNQSAGEYSAKTVSILPGDKEINNKSISVATPDVAVKPVNFVQFKSSTSLKRYEIFRLDKQPRSYSDFATGIVTKLSGQSEFVDTIKPNKKYYYIFRAVSVHDLISDPTAIYEVELVDDSGAIYPVIKTVDFAPLLETESIKKMKQYIHIVPTLKQSNMKISNLNAQTAATAGPKFGDLFGTVGKPMKFKIRFTSKSSGKKVDLNINFLQKDKALLDWQKDIEPVDWQAIADKMGNTSLEKLIGAVKVPAHLKPMGVGSGGSGGSGGTGDY